MGRLTVHGLLEALDGGLVLACESGVTDAAYVRERAEAIDVATLGGLAVDEATRAAARALLARDREEFLPDDPFALAADWLGALEGEVAAAVNIRASELEAVERVAAVCAEADAAVEINAHCRQPEMIAAGCGHALLRDRERLERAVTAAAATGATVGVKTRTGVGDDGAIARSVAAAGGEYLHIDCMDSPGAVDVVADAAPRLAVVANNGVRTAEDARAYLDRGADAVSTARGGRDPATLRAIRRGLPATC